MTYTATRDFSAQGVNFKIGQKINSTEYIALDAKYRANFKPDSIFNANDWCKVPKFMDEVMTSSIRELRDAQESIYKELLESKGIDIRNPEHLKRLTISDHPSFIILNLDGETILSMDKTPNIEVSGGKYTATMTYRANFTKDFKPLKVKK